MGKFLGLGKGFRAHETTLVKRVYIWENLETKAKGVLDANELVQVEVEGEGGKKRGAGEDKLQLLKTEVKTALKKQNFENVVKLCTSALKKTRDTPKRQLAWFYTSRAAAFMNMKRYIEAIGDANKALNCDANSENALVIKSNLLIETEKWEEAVVVLKRLLKLQHISIATAGPSASSQERRETRFGKTEDKLKLAEHEAAKIHAQKEKKAKREAEKRMREEEARRRLKAEGEQRNRAAEAQRLRQEAERQGVLQKVAAETASAAAAARERKDAEDMAVSERAQREAHEQASRAAEEEAAGEAEEACLREEAIERVSREREAEAAERTAMELADEASHRQMAGDNASRAAEAERAKRAAEERARLELLAARAAPIRVICYAKHCKAMRLGMLLWRRGCGIILCRREVTLALLSPMTTEVKRRNAACRPQKQLGSSGSLGPSNKAEHLVCAACSCTELVLSAKPQQLLATSSASMIANLGRAAARGWQRRPTANMPTLAAKDFQAALRGQVDWGVMGTPDGKLVHMPMAAGPGSRT
jgi:hypothetical protein